LVKEEVTISLNFFVQGRSDVT